MNSLRDIRKQKGLSQLKLAFATGIAPADISRIENEWITAYPGWRRRLAEALGVTEAEIFPNPRKATIEHTPAGWETPQKGKNEPQ